MADQNQGREGDQDLIRKGEDPEVDAGGDALELEKREDLDDELNDSEGG